MSVTTPRPGPPNPGVAAAAAASQAAQAAQAVRAVITSRRRSIGASLGGLPVANLVVIEIGLAIGLIVFAVLRTRIALYVAAGLVVLALIFAFLRWGGRWFTQWIGLIMRYTFRGHTRVAEPIVSSVDSVEDMDGDGTEVIGPKDARVNLLRLIVPDLVVAQGVDHERRPVGFAWHQGAWTAVLLVDAAPALVTPLGATPNLPLGALAPCLEDRGVILDAIQVIWHCYPGSAALPTSAPALASYL